MNNEITDDAEYIISSDVNFADDLNFPYKYIFFVNNEESVKKYINIIKENSSNLNFNLGKINYSTKLNQVCFYTDNDIDTFLKLDDNNDDIKNITDELKKNNSFNENQNNNIISLHSVLKFLSNEHYINHNRFLAKAKIKYDFAKKIITVLYSDINIKAQKIDEDIIILSKDQQKIFLFKEIYEDLRNIIELYENNKTYFTESVQNIKPVNLNINITINYKGLNIYKSINNNNILDIIYYFNSYSESEIDNLSCSANILDLTLKHESYLLTHIFVKIDDCPTWMRKKLYNIRKGEIYTANKIYEEESNNKETKKGKFKKGLKKSWI